MTAGKIFSEVIYEHMWLHGAYSTDVYTITEWDEIRSRDIYVPKRLVAMYLAANNVAIIADGEQSV